MAMASQPTIFSERIQLRPFEPSDADDVSKLAGDRAIADTTIRIPHPYGEGVAEKWIATHRRAFRKKESVVFAVVVRATGRLIGAIGLELDMPNESAELGYWIGKRYWNRGYATEAAETILMYGFTELGLHRIHSHHFLRNAASGRVLEKIGMKREGLRRRHVKKWEQFEDIVLYGILRDDYEGA
jgi:RimJ/RimL family protein N-acetyltransferase